MAHRRLWPRLPLLATVMLAGCASYHPVPLSDTTDLRVDPAAITVDTARLPIPALRHHRFDPSDGLDLTEVAMLAVANNPQLRVARAGADVARAQLYAAHLLPDPQLSLSIDHPTGHGPGLIDAESVGLGYDLGALVRHSAGVEAARAHSAQVRLDLLWQEWLVVQRSQILATRILTERQRVVLLQRVTARFRNRSERTQRALANHDITLETAGSDQTALIKTQSRLDQARKTLEATRQQLNALLGLRPTVTLHLKASPLTPLPESVYRQALQSLPRRRPDLLALSAGYRSQESQVRAAILAQFPSLSVGINRARDTSNVQTVGIGITLNLPLFSGARGQIATARASRARLHADYQARLDAAYAQLAQLHSAQRLLQRQEQHLARRLPPLERLNRRAGTACRTGDLAPLDCLNLQSTLLDAQLQRLRLRQSIWETRIAEAALLGWPDDTDNSQHG